MGFIKRRVSGNYFGGSRLIVPGQGVYNVKKYENSINKSKILKDNYNDIPSPTNTPTVTPTNTPTNTPTVTPTSTLIPCLQYVVINNTKSVCDVNYIDCLGGEVSTLINPLETIYICSISDVTSGCVGLNMTVLGVCT